MRFSWHVRTETLNNSLTTARVNNDNCGNNASPITFEFHTIVSERQPVPLRAPIGIYYWLWGIPIENYKWKAPRNDYTHVRTFLRLQAFIGGLRYCMCWYCLGLFMNIAGPMRKTNAPHNNNYSCKTQMLAQNLVISPPLGRLIDLKSVLRLGCSFL